MPTQQALIAHCPSLRRIYSRLKLESFLAVIEEWFKDPETRPQKKGQVGDDAEEEEEEEGGEEEEEEEEVTFATYAQYKDGPRKAIMDRIIEKDWVGSVAPCKTPNFRMTFNNVIRY